MEKAHDSTPLIAVLRSVKSAPKTYHTGAATGRFLRIVKWVRDLVGSVNRSGSQTIVILTENDGGPGAKLITPARSYQPNHALVTVDSDVQENRWMFLETPDRILGETRYRHAFCNAERTRT